MIIMPSNVSREQDVFPYPSEVTLFRSGGLQTVRGISLSSNGETLWVGGSSLYKVNTSDFSYTKITVPYSLMTAVTPDGAYVYCSQANSGNVPTTYPSDNLIRGGR